MEKLEPFCIAGKKCRMAQPIINGMYIPKEYRVRMGASNSISGCTPKRIRSTFNPCSKQHYLHS